MLAELLRRAKEETPLYMPEIRQCFEKEGELPLTIHAILYEGEERVFAYPLPRPEGKEQEAFLASYLYANVYNLLSTLGAKRLLFFTDMANPFLSSLVGGIPEVFQVDVPLEDRRGYGKCLNVNERILSSMGEEAFRMEIRDISEEEKAEREEGVEEAEGKEIGEIIEAVEVEETAARKEQVEKEENTLEALPEKVVKGRYLGVDIGGTDIKLAGVSKGKLSLCGEYDWNPAATATAEEFMRPILSLTKLMLYGLLLYEQGLEEEIPRKALKRGAGLSEVEEAVGLMEKRLAALKREGEQEGEIGREAEDDLLFDGIGVSFPDVVVENRIVGGETPKTKGFYASGDYEREFRSLGRLGEFLGRFVKEGGKVQMCNDGSMAAFTTAVEKVAGGEKGGCLCFSLGTDLGTGLITSEGRIPQVPLEGYHLLIDMGSEGASSFPSEDVRSTRGEREIPGCAGRYTSQSAIFRRAVSLERFAARDSKGDGDRFFLPREGKILMPPERRKEALEHYMALASACPSGPCGDAFFQVGVALAEVYKELAHFFRLDLPGIAVYGRLVKDSVCAGLIQQGVRSVVSHLQVEAADGEICETPLMRELSNHPVYTVAQFGQAVGAVYYAAS